MLEILLVIHMCESRHAIFSSSNAYEPLGIELLSNADKCMIMSPSTLRIGYLLLGLPLLLLLFFGNDRRNFSIIPE